MPFNFLLARWSIVGRSKKTLVVTQIIEFFLVLSIPVFYYTNLLSVAVVLVVMPLMSAIEQFSVPAEQAALPGILGKDGLVKGNSAFSFAYQGLNLVFNGLAGILVALVGAVTLYLVDSVTFAVAVLLFATLKLPKKVNKGEGETKTVPKVVKQYGNDLSEGFRFVMGSIIAKFFIGAVAANFVFAAAMAVMPAYADERGNAAFYGFMMATFSGGFLVGALLTSYVERFPVGKMQIVAYCLSTLLWISSVLVSWNVLSVVLFGMASVPIGAMEVLSTSVIQRIVPDRLLARTFSLMFSISMSAMPLGSLVGGALGSIFGSVVIFSVAAAGILLVAIVWFFVPDLRRLPKAKEIDPEKYGLTGTKTG